MLYPHHDPERTSAYFGPPDVCRRQPLAPLQDLHVSTHKQHGEWIVSGGKDLCCRYNLQGDKQFFLGHSRICSAERCNARCNHTHTAAPSCRVAPPHCSYALCNLTERSRWRLFSPIAHGYQARLSHWRSGSALIRGLLRVRWVASQVFWPVNEVLSELWSSLCLFQRVSQWVMVQFAVGGQCKSGIFRRNCRCRRHKAPSN